MGNVVVIPPSYQSFFQAYPIYSLCTAAPLLEKIEISDFFEGRGGCTQATYLLCSTLRPCLHGVGDPGLVG